MSSTETHRRIAGHIWSVADKLRGEYKRHEYGGVILPFTLLRRLDLVMAPARDKVRTRAEELADKDTNDNAKARLLTVAAGMPFYNTSKQDFESVAADSANVAMNLKDYVGKFSANAREIFEQFTFEDQIDRLNDADLLYQVVQRYRDRDLDLHPDRVTNEDMGYVFEHLIRLFSEDSNETAGEHFTPREVIKLMVNLLIAPDAETVAAPGQVVNIYDPACGTGGILTAADEHIRSLNPGTRVYLYGQELNGESWAVCQADMLMRQQKSQIVRGNSFSADGFGGENYRTFDYLMANPPFGVEWKKVEQAVRAEANEPDGRFSAGLPRINDGSFLFLQHMISKMTPMQPSAGKHGARLAIVFNGSPLFSGAAGSGESEIRRWILEQDLLEGIVALPDQLFFNTGISTYFWVLSNKKPKELRDKVILLDAREDWEKMRKSLGQKRKRISDTQIAAITQLYSQALDAAANPQHAGHAKVKVFATEDFGYQRITVERPLKLRFTVTDEGLELLADAKAFDKLAGTRDGLIEAFRPLLGQEWWSKKEARAALHEAAAAGGVPWPKPAAQLKAIWAAFSVQDPNGEIQTEKDRLTGLDVVLPDPDLRDNENVPLDQDIHEYFKREVQPHVPDAWIDETKTKTGYEIPFTRHFYRYEPPRPLAEIDAELKELEARIQILLGEVTG